MLVFHIAIPTHDLDAAAAFYTKVLGADQYRRYDDRVTLRFFGHQIVCHLSADKIDRDVELYPRHFGITFVLEAEFEQVHARCLASGWPIWMPRFIRWPEKPERHESFVIADPSSNLVEFKHYPHPRFIY